MPNSASAKKRLRQSEVRRQRNHSIKSAVRTQVKKVRQAIESGDVATSETEFKSAVIRLDKAAARGIMHANKAARTKSRLSKAIKGIKG